MGGICVDASSNNISSPTPKAKRFSIANVVFLLLSGYCILTAAAVVIGHFYDLASYDRDSRIVEVLSLPGPVSIEEVRARIGEEGIAGAETLPRSDAPSMDLVFFRKPMGHTLTVSLDQESSIVVFRTIEGEFSTTEELARALEAVNYPMLWLKSISIAVLCLLPPALWAVRNRSTSPGARLLLEISTAVTIVAVLYVSTGLSIQHPLYPASQ